MIFVFIFQFVTCINALVYEKNIRLPLQNKSHSGDGELNQTFEYELFLGRFAYVQSKCRRLCQAKQSLCRKCMRSMFYAWEITNGHIGPNGLHAQIKPTYAAVKPTLNPFL